MTVELVQQLSWACPQSEMPGPAGAQPGCCVPLTVCICPVDWPAVDPDPLSSELPDWELPDVPSPGIWPTLSAQERSESTIQARESRTIVNRNAVVEGICHPKSASPVTPCRAVARPLVFPASARLLPRLAGLSLPRNRTCSDELISIACGARLWAHEDLTRLDPV